MYFALIIFGIAFLGVLAHHLEDFWSDPQPEKDAGTKLLPGFKGYGPRKRVDNGMWSPGPYVRQLAARGPTVQEVAKSITTVKDLRGLYALTDWWEENFGTDRMRHELGPVPDPALYGDDIETWKEAFAAAKV